MRTDLRKFALTAHVSSSVGWLGSVAAFFALALAALFSGDEQQVRAASIAMELVGWFVIVPFSIASLLSGVIQSLTTSWGLLRHYWVIGKLLITVVASVLLMLHVQVVGSIAMAASNGSVTSGHMQGPKMQVVADAGAALLVLLIATALSIYKPQGRTDGVTPRWVYVSGAAVVAMILGVVVWHVIGGGMQSHL